MVPGTQANVLGAGTSLFQSPHLIVLGRFNQESPSCGISGLSGSSSKPLPTNADLPTRKIRACQVVTLSTRLSGHEGESCLIWKTQNHLGEGNGPLIMVEQPPTNTDPPPVAEATLQRVPVIHVNERLVSMLPNLLMQTSGLGRVLGNDRNIENSRSEMARISDAPCRFTGQ